MQVVLSDPQCCFIMSIPCAGRFSYMSTDTLVQKFFASFLISTLVPLALNLPMK